MHISVFGAPVIFDLPVTLTFYSIAAGLSLCICLVLMIFARFQPGTLVVRSWVIAVLVLSFGFFVSGIGPSLPVWATVIGTNTLLLSAGPILYSGFSAYCAGRRATPDTWGWSMVALTIPAFWYWGLIEPNGTFRSMAFSIATAAINGRTALLLGRYAVQRGSGASAKGMAILYAALTVWMTARFVILLVSSPTPPELRGANPTGWLTVFGYIVLMSLMSVCVMWMEGSKLKKRRNGGVCQPGNVAGFVEYFRNKQLLLWSAVTVVIVSVVSMLGIGYVNLRDVEKKRLTRTADLVNDAFVEHTIQVAGQIDTILRSVRGFYLRTHSITETESFVSGLGFDHSAIDNIYLIASDGRIILSYDPITLGRSVADREYFNFHRVTASDQIFISSVESGRVTGKFHFRLTRRIDNPDGSFGGLVLATVNPESFTRYYRELIVGSKSFASLLGISDRKLRARVPTPPSEQWAKPVDSPLWEALRKAPSGHYENTSQVDAIRRVYAYKTVGTLPLVMVTGFSNENLTQVVHERMSVLVITSLGTLAFTLMLALLLSIEAKRRDEHEQAEGALRKSEMQLRTLNETLQQRVEEETNRRIANEGLLTQSAKMAAMGEMIGAIAHQWRQPLATVGVIMQNLLAARKMNKLDEAYLEKATGDATNQIRHMSETIDSFRNFFKQEKSRERFNALEKIEEATAFIRAQLTSCGIMVNLPGKPDDDFTLNGFPNEFTQVILNLLANSRDAILEKQRMAGPGHDRITVAVERKQDTLVVEVIDTGCGIPPESADRLFEPYYTTKAEGQGTGIGLYMSRQIIEENMKGKLSFTSEPGETVFRIELPYA